MVEATDVAEQIQEAAEEQAASTERTRAVEQEHFRTRAALTIAILAMLLAVTSLGGSNAGTEMLISEVKATDQWAFFQAKNIRQTVNQLAAEELDAALLLHGDALGDDIRQGIQRTSDRYKANVERYESEPDPQEPANPLKGEGKKQLQAQAQQWEAQRDHAEAQGQNFDYSQALFQIAIVLGSVAIVAMSRPVLRVALVVGAVATALMLNGFFLFFALPG